MYRERLPQLDGGLFITDGGIETTPIFHQGLDLPELRKAIALMEELRTEHASAAPIVISGGGRCGTDHRHVEPVSSLWVTEPAQI